MNLNKCVSGKRVFESYDIALEALIQHHIMNDYKKGEGPINVYECQDCGHWHFTSREPAHSLFEDDDTIKRISLARRANYWEKNLKY